MNMKKGIYGRLYLMFYGSGGFWGGVVAPRPSSFRENQETWQVLILEVVDTKDPTSPGDWSLLNPGFYTDKIDLLPEEWQ